MCDITVTFFGENPDVVFKDARHNSFSNLGVLRTKEEEIEEMLTQNTFTVGSVLCYCVFTI